MILKSRLKHFLVYILWTQKLDLFEDKSMFSLKSRRNFCWTVDNGLWTINSEAESGRKHCY